MDRTQRHQSEIKKYDETIPELFYPKRFKRRECKCLYRCRVKKSES
jgi:hypothetical protein